MCNAELAVPQAVLPHDSHCPKQSGPWHAGPIDHPPPHPGAMHAPAAASAPSTQQPPVLIDDSDSDDCVVVSCTDGAGNTSARPHGSPLQPPTNRPGAPETADGPAAAPSAVPGSAQKRRRTHGGNEAPQPSRNAIPRIHADPNACGSRDVLPAPHAGAGAHGASTLPAPASQAGAPCTGEAGGTGAGAAAGRPVSTGNTSNRATARPSRYFPQLVAIMWASAFALCSTIQQTLTGSAAPAWPSGGCRIPCHTAARARA